ncbi:myb family transcription factor EFM [Rosa sericea]
MGAASPSELSLECKPHSYSMLLKSFGDHHHQAATTTPSHDLKQLEEILSRLEEERLKIDAFKRELPLSMQLLTTAVEASRQQLQAYRSSSANNQGPIRPVLEEFIPLKHSNSEGSEKPTNSSDKANWMTSVQLWSQADATKPKEQGDMGFNVSPKLALDTKQQRSYGGGAFHPFSKDIRNSGPSPNLQTLPELALGSPENKAGENMDQDNKCSELGENGINCGVVSTTQDQQGKAIEGQTSTITTTNTNTSTQNSSHRKARRCWSPDLHRRFVSALQMLGGSQVATPKQIRELMKVDGLTNDEVKSHLQKYRLHTRRPSPSPQTTGGPTPQLVVLGGIWVPPEYATAGHNGPTALYSPASHAPTHYCATPMPQDFYTTAQQQPQSGHHQLHHHTLHHQLHVYRASTTSRTQSSPESDLRGNGDRSESIEDGKSESGSWKAGTESGEKGMASRRSEDREESNGSQITLKF